MKDKYKLIIFSVILVVLMINLTSASFCCEKTKEGVWCQPKDSKNDCDTTSGLGYLQTGCESTSYCKMGTCIDGEKGECSPNTPQKNCDGLWLDKKIIEISQCEEACCVLGTESFLDTFAGCKKQAENYGLEVDFRKGIKNQIECRILSASNVKGACVYNKDLGVKTCKLTTEKECFEMKKTKVETPSSSSGGFLGLFGNKEENQTTYSINPVEFYRDTLCTAAKLETDCVPKDKTICSDGKVYFIDSCGNLANIYDANRQKDDIYWTTIFNEDEINCDDEKGNKNSANCGLCDDLAGSICGTPQETKPKFGNYICKSMDCKYNGKTYLHGSKWCAWEDDGNKGAKKNLPGSEHVVLGCYDGEVLPIEDCGDWRHKICIDSEVAGVINAGCIVSNGEDCISQNNSKDCLNTDKRNCLWVEDEFGLQKHQTNVLCVPKYAIGLKFWEPESGATADCSVASMTVNVVYEKGLFDDWDPTTNKWALSEDWINKMNKVCNAIGDCGSNVNYIGQNGWYEIKDLWTKS